MINYNVSHKQKNIILNNDKNRTVLILSLWASTATSRSWLRLEYYKELNNV